eukprot:2075286-Rhodomonas_salina.1
MPSPNTALVFGEIRHTNTCHKNVWGQRRNRPDLTPEITPFRFQNLGPRFEIGLYLRGIAERVLWKAFPALDLLDAEPALHAPGSAIAPYSYRVSYR